MALGKIKADTLEHSTAGSLDTQYVVNGSAKVWCHFNTSSSTSIRESFNISSLTDNAVGVTTPVFTSAMTNDDHIAVAGTSDIGWGGVVTLYYDNGVTSSQHRLRTASNLNPTANSDCPHVYITINGDLA